jgi:type I restriction enzyme R subunit
MRRATLRVALGKRDEDTLTTLAGRLARLDREVSREGAKTLSGLAGGKTLAELSKNLLNAVDPDAIHAEAVGRVRPPGAPSDAHFPEPTSEQLAAAQKDLITAACAPFDLPALRDALAKAKQDAEQTIDTVTIDKVISQGFDPAAKEKAMNLLKSFADYIETHQAEITALEILYRCPYQQRLTEPMLKELETKLRENHAAWTEDRLWDAFAQAKPGKVKGRSQAGRFADLVALVRFALEQQPVLKPFADSVNERFNEWLMDKAKAGVKFTGDQLAWLNLIRDHIVTTCSIETDDFDFAPFAQQGGLGRAHQLFGESLPALLDELNRVLAA